MAKAVIMRTWQLVDTLIIGVLMAIQKEDCLIVGANENQQA
mgnify:CR=1 FL=1